MKCYACNAEIKDTVKFCTKCGKPQQYTEAMIDAAISGDQDAIADLYNRTYNNVYRSIRILVKDEDTILDILQDSYIKGFQSLNQLDRPENFPAWMKRIAANKAKDYLKKKKPVLFTDLGDEDESPELSFADDNLNNLPDHVIDQQETTRLIDEILDSLSAEQRLAISLFYYDELSVKEIAEIMECSENTVKSRLNYGRKKIEAKVLELEKQGTKLYSLAPLPFLVWLLKGEASQAAVTPSKAVLQAIGQECAHIAVGTANTTAGNIAVQSSAKKATAKVAEHAVKSTVKAAAGTATTGVATKVTASILAVTLIGGGTAAVVIANRNEDMPPEITESVINEEAFEAVDSSAVEITEQPVPERNTSSFSESNTEIYAPGTTVQILDCEGDYYYTYVLSIYPKDNIEGTMEWHSTGKDFPLYTLESTGEYVVTIADGLGIYDEVYTKNIIVSDSGQEDVLTFVTNYLDPSKLSEKDNTSESRIGEYVVTRREEVIEHEEYFWENGIFTIAAADIRCRLPEITLDSEDAHICNQEIIESFDWMIDHAIADKASGASPILSAMDYKHWFYHGTETVLVSATYGDNVYGVYVLDVETGERLNNAAIAERFNLGNDYSAIIENTLQSKFNELYGGVLNNGGISEDFYSQQLERTLSDANVSQTVLYPAQDGTLMMKCTIFSIAGGESYEYLEPISK